jgi:hypothetical protein
MFLDFFIAYAENLLATFRTAGALLVGNSILVYYGVVGHTSLSSLSIGALGLTMAAIASTPFGKLVKKG